MHDVARPHAGARILEDVVERSSSIFYTRTAKDHILYTLHTLVIDGSSFAFIHNERVPYLEPET